MVRNSWRGAEYLMSKKPRLVRVKKACENKDFCGVSSGKWEQLKKKLNNFFTNYNKEKINYRCHKFNKFNCLKIERILLSE